MTKIDWLLKKVQEDEANRSLQTETPFCKEGDYDYSDDEKESIDYFMRKHFDNFSF